MFAIYDNQGRNFRSTLEDLYRVEGVRPVRNVKPLVSGEHEAGHNPPSPNKEAIQTYREIINAKRDEAIYHANQIMKRPVVIIPEIMPIIDCYNLILKRGINQIPVINSANKPVGIVTKENLLKVLLVKDDTISQSGTDSLRPVISQPLITADPVTDIRRIARVMYERKINCIPLTDDQDHIVGIITRTDIIHAVSIYPGITLWA